MEYISETKQNTYKELRSRKQIVYKELRLRKRTEDRDLYLNYLNYNPDLCEKCKKDVLSAFPDSKEVDGYILLNENEPVFSLSIKYNYHISKFEFKDEVIDQSIYKGVRCFNDRKYEVRSYYLNSLNRYCQKKLTPEDLVTLFRASSALGRSGRSIIGLIADEGFLIPDLFSEYKPSALTKIKLVDI